MVWEAIPDTWWHLFDPAVVVPLLRLPSFWRVGEGLLVLLYGMSEDTTTAGDTATDTWKQTKGGEKTGNTTS